MELELKLHEIMVNFWYFLEYALWSKFDKIFPNYVAANFENMLKREREGV